MAGRFAVLCLLALAFGSAAAAAAEPMLISPIMDGTGICPATVAAEQEFSAQSRAICKARGQTAAHYIGATLDAIGPRLSPSGRYELGYTLVIPVLDAMAKQEGGGWEVDPAAVAWSLQPLSELDRPAVVHLQSNHFMFGDNLALTQEMAADPANLMWTSAGPMLADSYFENVDVVSWSLASRDTPLNRLRRKAFAAFAAALCALPEAARARVRAVSVLGETHQMWTDFRNGMGYGGQQALTDYSPASVDAFRLWLARRFGDVAGLNQFAGARYASFDAVAPPSRDIHAGGLSAFQEHIDVYAGGTAPIVGWAHAADADVVDISVYLDGALQETRPASEARADVLDARPGFGTPLVGFRFDLDFSRQAPGVHALEILARKAGSAPVRLLSQPFVVGDRQQGPSLPVPGFPPPEALERAAWPELEAAVDLPAGVTAVYYNPLARLWSQFRNDQVRRHIEDFADIPAASCLGPGMVYSHQMTPQLYGSWNPERMAVEASLRPNPHYHLGVTLYGGIAWSAAAAQWLQEAGGGRYGIAELNPAMELGGAELLAMIERHRLAGARYLSPYFVLVASPRLDLLARGPVDHDRFMIDAKAPSPGGRAFYRALQELMTSQ